MADESTVKKELQEEFPTLKDQFLTDCSKIGAFLSQGDQSIMLKVFGILDQMMFMHLDEQLKPSAKTEISDDTQRYKKIAESYREYMLDRKKFTEKSSDFVLKHVKEGISNPFKHTLTSALNKAELHFGYPHNKDEFGHPRIYYVGFLESKEAFLDNIKDGFHWKDVGASPEHGEYTHRLQWFVIAMNPQLNIANRTGKVFIDVGAFREEAQKADQFNQKDLWPRLCDRPKLDKGGHACAESTTDFRCPENMNLFLSNSQVAEQRLPLLNAFLNARYNKRVSAFGVDDAFPDVRHMKIYTSSKQADADVDNLVGKGKPNQFKGTAITK